MRDVQDVTDSKSGAERAMKPWRIQLLPGCASNKGYVNLPPRTSLGAAVRYPKTQYRVPSRARYPERPSNSRHSSPGLGWPKWVASRRWAATDGFPRLNGGNRPDPDVPGGAMWYRKQALKRDRRHISVYSQSGSQQQSPRRIAISTSCD